jgi:ribonuclease-3 family protein
MENLAHTQNYYKNALVLAYLGDSVFTLMVREYLVINYDYKPNILNKKANGVVCAKTQAEIMNLLKPTLTEEENDIDLRARNSHLANNKAKNSTIQEYSLATQFEALVGFWYLNGNKEKLDDLFKKYIVEKL